MQGRGARLPHEGSLRGDRARRVPGVGAQRPDDGRPRPPRARLRPARRHEDLARAGLPAASRSAGWCSTATRRTSSPRTSRSRSARACWSTGSTSPTTRCSSGGTFSYSDTQRYRVGPNYLQLPVNQPKNGRGATNQRDSQMAYYVDQTGENPRVNYEPSITGGLREAPKPAHDEQGPEISGRAHPRAHPAHRRLPPGRRALPALRAVGEGRPRRQPRHAAGRVRPPDPGAHGLAPVPGRRRARPACRRRPRHHRRRRPLAHAGPDAGLGRGRAAAPRQPRQQRPARRRGPRHDALRAERARGASRTSPSPPPRRGLLARRRFDRRRAREDNRGLRPELEEEAHERRDRLGPAGGRRRGSRAERRRDGGRHETARSTRARPARARSARATR